MTDNQLIDPTADLYAAGRYRRTPAPEPKPPEERPAMEAQFPARVCFEQPRDQRYYSAVHGAYSSGGSRYLVGPVVENRTQLAWAALHWAECWGYASCFATQAQAEARIHLRPVTSEHEFAPSDFYNWREVL